MNNIPRLPRFAHLPTPIEELPRLSSALGGPRILIKRDDQTGLAFGGNKTRKLEFLLAEAKAQNADTIITAGAVQSNHCRQTAAAAARFGLRCILVLYGDKPEQISANLLLDELFNAEIVWTDRAHRDEILQQTYTQVYSLGRSSLPCTLWGIEPNRRFRLRLRDGRIGPTGTYSKLDRFCVIVRWGHKQVWCWGQGCLVTMDDF